MIRITIFLAYNAVLRIRTFLASWIRFQMKPDWTSDPGGHHSVRIPSDLLHFFKQNSFVVAKTGWERMCEVKGSSMVERLSETG